MEDAEPSSKVCPSLRKRTVTPPRPVKPSTSANRSGTDRASRSIKATATSSPSRTCASRASRQGRLVLPPDRWHTRCPHRGARRLRGSLPPRSLRVPPPGAQFAPGSSSPRFLRSTTPPGRGRACLSSRPGRARCGGLAVGPVLQPSPPAPPPGWLGGERLLRVHPDPHTRLAHPASWGGGGLRRIGGST